MLRDVLPESSDTPAEIGATPLPRGLELPLALLIETEDCGHTVIQHSLTALRDGIDNILSDDTLISMASEGVSLRELVENDCFIFDGSVVDGSAGFDIVRLQLADLLCSTDVALPLLIAKVAATSVRTLLRLCCLHAVHAQLIGACRSCVRACNCVLATLLWTPRQRYLAHRHSCSSSPGTFPRPCVDNTRSIFEPR